MIRQAENVLISPSFSDFNKNESERTSYSIEKKTIYEDDSENDRTRQRRKSGYFDSLCCCPCSTPLLLGLIAGGLTMGVVFATLLSLYLVSPATTTSAIIQITETSVTTTSATTATTKTTSTTSSTSSTSSTTTTTSTTSSTSSTSSTSATTSTTSTTSTSTTTTSTSATTATTTSATTATTTSVTTVTTSTSTTTTTTKPVCTTRVTFDNIPGQTSTSGIVPNGYNNLNYTNVMYLNASTEPLSGYPRVEKSSPYVAYNPSGATVRISSANGTSFSFDSIEIISAWRFNLTWSIYAYRYGVNTIAGSFSINTVNTTTIYCGTCTNLDTLYFVTSGGTPVNGLSQNGTEFGFDDLCISFGY